MRARRAVVVAALLGLLGASVAVASTASAGIATAKSTIAIPATAGTLPVGVTFNPTGKKAFIAINGSDVIETVTLSNSAVSPITLTSCSGPMSIAITPNNLKAYVACYNSNSVVAFTPSAPVATAHTIPVGTEPFFIAMSPDGTKAYVPNSGGATGTVSVIDTSTDTVTATIPVGLAPVAVAFNPTGTTAYVASGTANPGGNVVTMIDVATSTVPAGTDALPNPISLNGVPYGLAVSPDGASLWVSRDNGKQAAVISTATNTLTNNFFLTGKPEGVTFSPDGRRVYMPMQSGGVAVFDAANKTQLPYLASGTGSRIMAFTPDGLLAYVTNTTDNTVSTYSFDYTLPTISGVPDACSIGTAYSFTPTVTGPGVTVSLQSGSLPPGLTLSGGVVSGTPTAGGDYPVTLRATNDNGSADLAITFSIPIPNYSVTFDAAGGSPGPGDQTVASGSMATQPPDEPTRSGYAFDGWWDGVTQWDFATDPVTGDLALTAHWLSLPTITGAATEDAPFGAAFTWTPTITAVSGYTVTSTVLPAGLTLDASTGVITGAPTGALGPTAVTVTVTDANGTASADTTLTVTHGSAVSLAVTASDLHPDQGATITVTTVAQDSGGNTWDATGTATITSSVASDTIVGNLVTFNHASLHLLTATLGVASGSVLVQVVPAITVLGFTGGTVALWLLPWAPGAFAVGIVFLIVAWRRERIGARRG